MLNGIVTTGEYMNFLGYAPLSPFEAVSSTMIFAGFAMLSLKCNFTKLSSYSFLIYLIHAGVFDVFSILLKRFGCSVDSRIVILAESVLIFFVSWGLAIIYRHIWERVDRKFSLTSKLCSALGIE